MYMCRHAAFLWDLYGSEMRVEPMFNELVRDNQKVIQCVTKTEVSSYVSINRYVFLGFTTIWVVD